MPTQLDEMFSEVDQKSDNLQYNTLARWDERLIDQASDVLSIIIFIISYRLKAYVSAKILNWHSLRHSHSADF